MRKNRILFFVLFSLLACLMACVRERLPEGRAVFPEGSPVDISLRFGASEPVLNVTTKSTLGLEPESMIFNMYVFIFDMNNDGKKICGQYFDYSNLSQASGSAEWWEVQNNVANAVTGDLETKGTVHLHTISKPNCRIAVVCNIDAEMVNVSPEQLGTVESYSDLFGQKAKLNQLITSRSGYFPMSGQLAGVNTGDADSWGTLPLRRLDSKIVFKVYVDTATVDAKGVEPVSRIASFTPTKWRVVNLPKNAYVLERGDYKAGVLTEAEQSQLVDAATTADDFFDMRETNFETETLTKYNYSGTTINKKFIHGFSFYMMENRKPIRNYALPPASYADRERQEKEDAVLHGTYATVKNGAFLNANELSTYVVLSGKVKMDNVTYGASEGATLSADVTYTIHLGDFSGDKWADFNTFRNHTYVYDVIIRDVDDIRVEVQDNYDMSTLGDKLHETEPGASGSVSVALEEVFTSDAHYSSHVVTFHAKNIDENKVTWVVETPFNPSGASPVEINGVENTTGIDFEWVEFRVNDMDKQGVYFENARQIYKPRSGPYSDGKTMNISELVAYLKKNKKAYSEGRTNAFDNTTETVDGVQVPNPKISVTAFVNEYYYEKNPITGDYQPDLWKRFVNKDMRSMHILSETKISADGQSRIIGSSFTIQQQSIQSIFNINNPDLPSAWGSEHVDDEMEQGTKKHEGGARNNTSQTNGRLNTLKEWALYNTNGTNRILGDETEEEAYWDHYMNLTADNDTPPMLPKYQNLRYSCMSRNRDNNGNGVIDEDEVRWYMAATNQLIGLFLGSYGIEGDARLYQRNVQERSDVTSSVWREHVISSTKWSSNAPTVIWAEEGSSGGDPSGSSQWAGISTFSTRCVRNLGYDAASGGDFTFASVNSEPANYIVMRRLKDGSEWSGSWDDNVYYEFDCSRINEASLRFYTNRELVSHDEHSENACLYKKFVFAPKKDAVIVSTVPEIKDYTYPYQVHQYIDTHIGNNPYCPPGYRLPNIREIVVLRNFMPSGDVSSYMDNGMTPSRTLWSYGVAGQYYDIRRSNVGNRYCPGVSSQKVFMLDRANGSQRAQQIRCVKDVKD
ncbi:MAG: hypothetical protein K6E44_06425 [Bacteroidales bacterium]|nr:hypothetical protein [Bacteroidales bacterium]